jgi:hypothetical protein
MSNTKQCLKPTPQHLSTIQSSSASPAKNVEQDFGWCTAFQEDIINNPLGSRASTVMINSSYNDLHAIQAALLFLQMQLKHIWHHQMQFRVITKHEALLDALCQLFKTDTHNPQWQLNRNWEILQSLNHNNELAPSAPSAMCSGCHVFGGRALEGLLALLFPSSLVLIVKSFLNQFFPDFHDFSGGSVWIGQWRLLLDALVWVPVYSKNPGSATLP